jgi:hypothetical protein
MKKQSLKSRLKEHLGSEHGKKKQTMSSRLKESSGMEKEMGKPAKHAIKAMQKKKPKAKKK